MIRLAVILGCTVAITAFIANPAQSQPTAQAEEAGEAEEVRAMTLFVASRDGVSIAYETHGAGEPALVFIHGWSCDRRYWDAQLAPFASDYRIVAVDLGGHGESGMERTDWTIDSFGGDIAAVVEALGLNRVMLIGHSMGGDVAVAAEKRLPGRVAGIVWIDTYRTLGAPRSAADVESLVAPFRSDFAGTTRLFVRGMFAAGADPALVDRVAKDMASAPPEVALPAIQSSLTYGRTITAALQDLKSPVVAINPSDPPSDVPAMRRFGVEVVPMAGVGHFPMMEAPKRFNATLAKVIAERFGDPVGEDRD